MCVYLQSRSELTHIFLIREKPIFIEARVDDMLQTRQDRWKVDEQSETDICLTEYLVIILKICSYLDGEIFSFLNRYLIRAISVLKVIDRNIF